MVRGIEKSYGDEYYKDDPERKEGLTPDQEELLKKYESLNHQPKDKEIFDEQSFDTQFDQIYEESNMSNNNIERKNHSQQEKIDELFAKIGKTVPMKDIHRMYTLRIGSHDREANLDEVAEVMEEIKKASNTVEDYVRNDTPFGGWRLT